MTAKRRAAAPHREYLHPPIVDAVIELRFADDVGDDVKEKLSKKISAEYELCEKVEAQTISVAFNPETVSATRTVADRIVRRTKSDSSQSVQIGNRILNVGGNAPYEGWSSLFQRFDRTWKAARRIWKFRTIDRIGVRYINRLDLEMDESKTVNYEDYLHLRINLPEEFPLISDYDLSFQTSRPEIQCGVTVRSGAVPPAVPGRASFVLDIDVWREIAVPQKEEDVHVLLGKMREAKNELFETFVTDKARKLFDAA